MDFTGNMVALVTPFRNGSFDRDAFVETLIERVIDGRRLGGRPLWYHRENPRP